MCAKLKKWLTLKESASFLSWTSLKVFESDTYKIIIKGPA